MILKVYDVFGNEILELLNGWMEEEKYRLPFENKNLPSGIYLLNFQTQGGSITEKMYLVR